MDGRHKRPDGDLAWSVDYRVQLTTRVGKARQGRKSDGIVRDRRKASASEQIRDRSGHMKTADVGRTKRARTSRTVCTEAPCGNPECLVGTDLHKFMQAALMDSDGWMRMDGTGKRTTFLAFVC